MKNRIAVALLVLLPILMFAPNPAATQESSQGTRKVATKTPPPYPAVARRMGIQGSVRMEVLVAPNGSVKSIELRGGHPMLAEAAESAVRQWKWEPAPHETQQSVEIKFAP
jgi:TonB family protein